MASGWDTSVGEACQVESETIRKKSREVELLHRAMSLYAGALDSIPPRESDPAALIQMGFISQSFNSLFSAIQAAKQGLYFQSLGSMRFVFESWVTIQYLAKFPSEAEKWSNRPGGPRPPKVDTMHNKISHVSRAAKKHTGAHRTTLSRFVHSDPFAVHYLLGDDSSGTVVHWGMVYDARSFDACCFEIALWLGIMLSALGAFVPDNSEWHVEFRYVAEAILKLVDEAHASHKAGQGK